MDFRKIVGSCLLAVVITPAAMAEDSGFYMGLGIGQSRQEFNEFHADDTAYKLFGGWSFNEYFAVEGGYIDGGTQSDTLGQIHVDISSDGFFAEGIAKWPIGRFVAPYAKLGYVFYDTTQKLSVGSQSASESDSTSDFIFGGGIELKLGGNFRLRAEYEKVNVANSAYDILSLGAAWQF
jgi:OmpA-OmpF porin, OOP family